MITPALLVLLAEAASPTCPDGMKLVTGTHHENVERLCLDHRQDTCWSYFPWLMAFEGRDTAISTCIDEFEWPNEKGASPPVMMNFHEAEASCASVGKRLCTEFEWELACEGPDTLPFGYGWAFEKGRCVNDKPYKGYEQKKLSSGDQAVRDKETKRLYQAEGSGSREACVSPFGVRDLLGNVEEWVRTSRPEWPHASSLKGGFWAKPRSACRGTNDSHAPAFRFYEIGFRCCAEPTPPASAPAVGSAWSAQPYDASLHSRSPFITFTSFDGRIEIASRSSGVPARTLAFEPARTEVTIILPNAWSSSFGSAILSP